MIPEDFKRLLPEREAAEPSSEPEYYLWVFDPDTAKVHVEHNTDRHPARRIDHSDLAEKVSHPERIHGYAYRLRHGQGFRITDWDHKEIKDPYVKRQVSMALQGRQTAVPSGSQIQARAK